MKIKKIFAALCIVSALCSLEAAALAAPAQQKPATKKVATTLSANDIKYNVNTGDARATGNVVIKRECYVFDFALDRALRMISDYSCRLKVDENVGPEQKVGEFIDFLPVLAYDGSSMHQVGAAEVPAMAMSRISAALT